MRPADVAALAEALALLTVASATRRALPTRRWHPLLGEPVHAPTDGPDGATPTGTEAGVQRAVHRAALRVPWHANCLDQAIAAQLMLRLRRQPGTAIIGLRRGVAWDAHAWVVGRTGTVVGGPASAGFTAVSAFRPAPRAGGGTG